MRSEETGVEKVFTIHDVSLERDDNGNAVVNVPREIIVHSPTGYDWGYQGSGPADLALNIVARFVGRSAAEKNGLYQEFKRKFIAIMPEEGGVISKDEIEAWFMEQHVTVPSEQGILPFFQVCDHGDGEDGKCSVAAVIYDNGRAVYENPDMLNLTYLDAYIKSVELENKWFPASEITEKWIHING